MISIQKGLSWFTESPGRAGKDSSLNHRELFPDMHIRSWEFGAAIAVMANLWHVLCSGFRRSSGFFRYCSSGPTFPFLHLMPKMFANTAL